MSGVMAIGRISFVRRESEKATRRAACAAYIAAAFGSQTRVLRQSW